jgi:hypothetical protein
MAFYAFSICNNCLHFVNILELRSARDDFERGARFAAAVSSGRPEELEESAGRRREMERHFYRN